MFRIFTLPISRHIQKKDIILGVVRTEVIRNILGHYQIILNTILLLITPLWCCFTKSPEQGAQTSIYLASDRRLNHVTGKYFK
ncbi:unnamed protein product [Adineta steineri]|uniref:Uncharacterized protein n=1 Tax=Adineta steineri TaxID=433720 RepID=A0A820IW73_9BILA|nr:unnamed protein product [Adineta steineri]